MNKIPLDKLLSAPDKDEIVGKLILGLSPHEIHEWLKSKYSAVSEKQFVLSEKTLQLFKDNYLDIYQTIQEDLQKTKAAIATNTEEDLQLAVQGNSAYKNAALTMINNELDVHTMIARLCTNVELRLSQVFDVIQEDPRNINTRVDRLLKEYSEVLGALLEKYYKFCNPENTININHSVSVQVVDQHAIIIGECIREILQEIDVESSMLFLDKFSEKMARLKLPSPDAAMNPIDKLAEVKVISETINKKLSGGQ
jgi:hypothetical protein